MVDPILHDDVPLHEEADDAAPIPVGPAQEPVTDTVLVPVSGAGIIGEPVTAASVEFDVLDGFDNASVEVVATPDLPADLDLYLEPLEEDGTRGEPIAAAESESLESETLTAGRLGVGRYRVVVHNWAGAPTTAEVVITFRNQDGEPG